MRAMKKPTKKELREMSDGAVLIRYGDAVRRATRIGDARSILPTGTVKLRCEDKLWRIAEAYRAEILRRMGGAK